MNFSLLNLVGLALLIAGAVFLIVEHAIVIGIVCLVAGLVVLGGVFGPGYNGRL